MDRSQRAAGTAVAFAVCGASAALLGFLLVAAGLSPLWAIALAALAGGLAFGRLAAAPRFGWGLLATGVVVALAWTAVTGDPGCSDEPAGAQTAHARLPAFAPLMQGCLDFRPLGYAAILVTAGLAASGYAVGGALRRRPPRRPATGAPRQPPPGT